MSLPPKPAQLSIRSFFQAKTPKYAPPPSQSPSLAAPPPPPPLPNPEPAEETHPEDQKPQRQQQHGDAAPPAPPLPREASVRPIAPEDVNALRRINALLLPVAYPDRFYRHAATGRFNRVITWAHDGAEPKVVGGVVCRLEPDLPGGQVPQNLYIQSLCLLAPYRGMGLVSAALESIMSAVVADANVDVRTVTAHVWTENGDALKWYQGRGFKRDDRPILGYYMKLRPDSAWLVSRDVGASVRSSLPLISPAPSRPISSSTTAAVVNLPAMPGPPRATPLPPPPRTGSGQSFQHQRPGTEWNDLPDDMAPSLLAPPRRTGSEPSSGTSSRSSSTARKKRDRSYPAAAFGGS